MTKVTSDSGGPTAVDGWGDSGSSSSEDEASSKHASSSLQARLFITGSVGAISGAPGSSPLCVSV